MYIFHREDPATGHTCTAWRWPEGGSLTQPFQQPSPNRRGREFPGLFEKHWERWVVTTEVAGLF